MCHGRGFDMWAIRPEMEEPTVLRALALTPLTGLFAWCCHLCPSSPNGLTKVTVAFAFAVNGQPFSCTETYKGVGMATDAGTDFRALALMNDRPVAAPRCGRGPHLGHLHRHR